MTAQDRSERQRRNDQEGRPERIRLLAADLAADLDYYTEERGIEQ